MKKYIPLLIIVSLLLSTCSINKETNNKVTEPEQNKEFLFKKKQECVAHQSQIEKDIEKYTYNVGGDESRSELDEIFYSPIKNSCLYIFHTYQSGSMSSGSRSVVDFFTKETIYYAYSFCTFSGGDCSKPYTKDQNGYIETMITKEDLEQKIKQLKGEKTIDIDQEYENYLKVINS